MERLSEELRAGSTESARLAPPSASWRASAISWSASWSIRRERDELAAAKRALEQVHAALAQARARLG